VGARMALDHPALIRTLTLHEPALLSVLPSESDHGKAARADRRKFVGPDVQAAAKAGDSNIAVRLFFEGVYQLGSGRIRSLATNRARNDPGYCANGPTAARTHTTN